MDWSNLVSTYNGRNIFVTGHTGFKGTWMITLLESLGANVSGYSLTNSNYPLFNRICRSIRIKDDHRGDIRDIDSLRNALQTSKPDLIIHLAAQSLVSVGIKDPINTYSINVIGTAKVLQAASEIHRPVLAISSDKCYRPDPRPRKVGDPLGGIDPYSASKAAMEMICMAQSDQCLVGVARSGNAIGGGDWAASRLIPDYFRALQENKKLKIRSPTALRPWQHVLEPIWGYAILGGHLMKGKRRGPWNFGPNSSLSVGQVLDLMGEFGPKLNIEKQERQYAENKELRLDSRRTLACLGWKNQMKTETAIKWTVEAYLQLLNTKCNALKLMQSQINAYAKLWAGYPLHQNKIQGKER